MQLPESQKCSEMFHGRCRSTDFQALNIKRQWRSWDTLCPGARNILAPPVIKSAEFEVKNRCKSAKDVKV